MTPYLENIRNACIKASPEIMELKFGCEVMLLLGDYYGEIGRVVYPSGKCTKHKLYKNCNEDCDIKDAVSIVTNWDDEPSEWLLLSNGKDYKVLGREIRLADVLLAIKSSPKCDTLWEYEVISDLIWGKTNKQIEMWNLRKDSLSEQSEETLKFISDLLK